MTDSLTSTTRRTSIPPPDRTHAIRRRRRKDTAVRYLITSVAMLAASSIVLVFAFVAREAVPLFWDRAGQEEIGGILGLVSPTADSRYTWQPVGFPGKYNIVPLLLGSLKVTILAIVIGAPLAVLAAVFTTEYAPKRLSGKIKVLIELLAGVPSVVLGFFLLIVVASPIQALTGATYRLNSFVASLGLAIAVVPIVYSISEDALSVVPKELAAAATALGARHHQVIFRIIFPAALPGIAAAVILGFGRALGETMIVLMASGNAAVMSWSPVSSARTVTATLASELGEVPHGTGHYRVLFLLGTILFIFTFVVNRLGVRVVDGLRQKMSRDSR